MSATSVRKPSITIQTPGGAASVEGVTFITAVNSAPTVEVLLRRAKQDVVKPMSSEVLAAMKAAQQSRFEMRGAPDTTVSADDGNGGKLEFKGYLVAPVLEQSKVSSSETANVVGVDSFLNGLGLSIYNSRPANVRKEETDKLFKATPNRSTGDIVSLMREVTDVLVGNIGATINKTETESLKKVALMKHAANSMALDVWREILSGSNVKYPEWQSVFAKMPKLGEAAAERVKELLQQRTSSFWDVLNGLGSEFLFFYRPNMDGSSGSLVRVDRKINEVGSRLDAGITRFSGTDGSPSMLPLAGTILYGPVLPKLRKEEKPYSVTTVVGQWPVAITPGYFQEVGAPAWLVAGGGSGFESFVPKETPAAATPSTKKDFNPNTYKASRKDLEAKLVEAEASIVSILQAYAKVMYEDMRLADSTATLEVPLDFTVKVGVRYRFTTGTDGGTFSGFVRALRHTLNIQGGATLTSGTVLSLTHIQYD